MASSMQRLSTYTGDKGGSGSGSIGVFGLGGAAAAEEEAPAAPPVELQPLELALPVVVAAAAVADTCRVCWGEAEPHVLGGDLVSVCACAGTARHIHVHCLRDWQRTLREQGRGRRAAACEVCHAPYAKLPSAQQRLLAPPPWPHTLAARTALAARDALDVRLWPRLAVRMWRVCAVVNGLASALRVGASGFVAGLGLGCSVIEQQATLLDGVRGAAGRLLGWPLAELLCWQAGGALVMTMVSELVYTTALGALGGVAFGFASGYVGAIRGSGRAVLRGGGAVLGGAGGLGVRLLRGVVRVVARGRSG